MNVNERARRIRLLLMDVDGVLTDGRLYNIPLPGGGVAETKAFDSQDGIALQWIAAAGIQSGVISGRFSPATEERARQCKMSYVYQGHSVKKPIYEEILAKSGFKPEEIAYVGDDLTDAIIMKRIGLAVAPANARPEAKQYAHLVTENPGGRGAVREVCELLLKSQGHWEAVLAKYEVE